MITTAQALVSLRPNVEWTMHGDDIEGIIWHTEGVKPLTQAEVDAEIIKLQAVAAAKETDDDAARAAALAHARSLGFTDEMIAVMYPGLVEAGTSPTQPEPTFADLTKRDEPPIVDP